MITKGGRAHPSTSLHPLIKPNLSDFHPPRSGFTSIRLCQIKERLTDQIQGRLRWDHAKQLRETFYVKHILIQQTEVV